MQDQADLLPGTFDLVILKAVSLGAVHGYGVLLRIEQISGGGEMVVVRQGACGTPRLSWMAAECRFTTNAQGCIGLPSYGGLTAELSVLDSPPPSGQKTCQTPGVASSTE